MQVRKKMMIQERGNNGRSKILVQERRDLSTGGGLGSGTQPVSGTNQI